MSRVIMNALGANPTHTRMIERTRAKGSPLSRVTLNYLDGKPAKHAGRERATGGTIESSLNKNALGAKPTHTERARERATGGTVGPVAFTAWPKLDTMVDSPHSHLTTSSLRKKKAGGRVRLGLGVGLGCDSQIMG